VRRLLRLWAALHGPHGLRAQLLYAEAAGQGVELGDFDDDIGGARGAGNVGNDGGGFEGGGGEGAGGGEALLRRLGAAEAAAEAEEAVTHNAAALVVRLLRGAQQRAAVVEAAEARMADGALFDGRSGDEFIDEEEREERCRYFPSTPILASAIISHFRISNFDPSRCRRTEP